MGTRTITISPITRLEGHGRIEIFLNEEGNVGKKVFYLEAIWKFAQKEVIK
jgi:F420-non-reducing hydrogenase large subunit